MAENNVSVRSDESDKERSIAWMQIFQITNGKEFPHTEVSYFPRPCMQCEEDGRGHHSSPCVTVCVSTATRLDPNTGIVSQIYTRCFGCRYCMGACPYHARYFNWWDPVWPEGMEKSLSPDVSARMRGVVEKCSFCYHRRQLALEKAHLEGRRELEEDEYQTSCTQACPAGAIVFGDVSDPDSRVHRLSRNPRGYHVLGELGLRPAITYMAKIRNPHPDVNV